MPQYTLAVKKWGCFARDGGATLRAMAVSPRMRKWMQLAIALASGAMFFAQCADHTRPYLRIILGKRDPVAHESAGPR